MFDFNEQGISEKRVDCAVMTIFPDTDTSHKRTAFLIAQRLTLFFKRMISLLVSISAIGILPESSIVTRIRLQEWEIASSRTVILVLRGFFGTSCQIGRAKGVCQGVFRQID